MFRHVALVVAGLSVGCGTVENEPSDAPVAVDGATLDGSADMPDGGQGPGDPDAGPAVPLEIGDTSHDFQRVTIGAAGQPFTTRVSNLSGAPLGPLQVAITGDAAAEFAVSDDGCDDRVLGAGTDCQITVNFNPQQPGARAARLDVMAEGEIVSMELAGIGLTLGALAITPGDGHGFGNVVIGQISAARMFTITNTGESPIARPTVALLNGAGFSVDDNTCVAELAPLGTCTATVTFRPPTGGGRTASLVASSGDNSAAAALGGTGTGTIRLQKNGDGASVSSVVGGGIDCGTSCEATIGHASVGLVASTPAGTELTGWSIDGCGTNTRCDIPVDRASRTVDVTFRNRYLLTVMKSGGGAGRVTGTGVDCGSDCEEALFAQTNVALQATADSGHILVSWTGCTTTSGTTCNVTMGSQAKTVTARFERVQTLTVTVAGDGAVTSNPSGIGCPGDCSEVFVQGTSVVLTATPGSNQVLEYWLGAGCSGAAATCTVAMNAAQSVHAQFGPRYRLHLVPTIAGASITATPGPSGGSTVCTNTNGCDLVYGGRTSVTLTTRHSSPLGHEFVGWSGGGCSGTGSCTVDVSTQRSVTAIWRVRE
jgi:hypothetical protein